MHQSSTRYALFCYLLIGLCAFSKAQTPTILRKDIQIDQFMKVSNQLVRIAFDKTDNTFYTIGFEGNVFKINNTNNGTKELQSLGDASSHDINYLQGLAIKEGIIYIVGNHKEEGKKGYGIVAKGIKNADGSRKWVNILKTEAYPSSATLYDHAFSNIIFSPDGKFMYITSGSRTDHGEVQSTGGLYPNTREVALTSAIFKFPINTEGLFLANTYQAIDSAGYVFARGVRNTFDMAYAPNGDFFGVENSGDGDDSEEINWLQEGSHYGFPWEMGGNQTPQQFPSYDPSKDKMVNHLAAAWERGYFTNDPTYPAPPKGVVFKQPIPNFGPDADKYRDPVSGTIFDASDQGKSMTSFTSHRSPLGLVFDKEYLLTGDYKGKGFVLSYSDGQGKNGAKTMIPFNDNASDLLILDLKKDTKGQYSMNANKIAEGFNSPVDAEIVGNKLYVLENGGTVWVLTLPLETSPVTFSKLPQNLQLFPRDTKNEAVVSVTGKVLLAGYTKVSVIVSREKKLFKYQNATLNYQNGTASFNFATTIKAELANYDFRVFLVKDKDSVEVATRDNIVAGDVYLVSGQSNATPNSGLNEIYPYKIPFCRSFGKNPEYDNLNNNIPYNLADTTFLLSADAKATPGIWMMEVQRYIAENYGIPTLAVSGAVAGSGIDEHLIRQEGIATIYDKLLLKTRKAGVQNQVKAIFWRQGEAESSSPNGGKTWGAKYDVLQKLWRGDYGNQAKVYVFQIEILNNGFEAAGELRDFQRKVKELYPNTDNISTVGTVGYEGLHYKYEGYLQTGAETFRLVARDFYGAKDTTNIASPNLKKAFYTSTDKKEITLVFDENQQMVFPKDTLIKSVINNALFSIGIKEHFYLNETGNAADSGRSEGNKIFIKLKKSASANQLTYLPSGFVPSNSNTFVGPYLKNSRGMRAFSFYKYPIADVLPITVLKAQSVGFDQIKLSWTKVTGATQYLLERLDDSKKTYKIITKIDASAIEYTDKSLLANTRYDYRIKLISNTSESDYSFANAQTDVILLSNFKAQTISFDQIDLSWNQLANISSYQLDRSDDGKKTFKEIAKLTSDVVKFTDKMLIANTLYDYRLKATTSNSVSDYVFSQARTNATLVLGSQLLGREVFVTVYPNPTLQSVLQLDFGTIVSGKILLRDLTGKEHFETHFQQINSTKIDLPKLPSGSYFLQIDLEGKEGIIQKLLILN